jgi:IMP cyclohydrolase
VYVGRIVGVGRTLGGRPVSAYRVSSRSFPNRNAERSGQSVRIVPRPGSADAASDSPYIAYECAVWDGRFAVLSNGTHTRPIFERLKAGNAVRDAIASVLVGLDREFDDHDTPRICGVMDVAGDALWLGSVTAEALAVMPIRVEPGTMAYVTTYEFPLPSSSQVDPSFSSARAVEVCHHVTNGSVFAGFERPICAAAVVATDGAMEVAALNVAS